MGGPAARHGRPGGGDFLLKTEMSAGHGGVSGRYQAWHDRAFTQAWILDRMGSCGRPGSAPLRAGRLAGDAAR